MLHEDPRSFFIVQPIRVIIGRVFLVETNNTGSSLLLFILRDADVNSSKEVEESVLLLFYMTLQYSLTNRSQTV